MIGHEADIGQETGARGALADSAMAIHNPGRIAVTFEGDRPTKASTRDSHDPLHLISSLAQNTILDVSGRFAVPYLGSQSKLQCLEMWHIV